MAHTTIHHRLTIRRSSNVQKTQFATRDVSEARAKCENSNQAFDKRQRGADSPNVDANSRRHEPRRFHDDDEGRRAKTRSDDGCGSRLVTHSPEGARSSGARGARGGRGRRRGGRPPKRRGLSRGVASGGADGLATPPTGRHRLRPQH